MNKILISTLTALICPFSLGIAAPVTAEFADGNSTSAVDGYVGTAGAGWKGPWVLVSKDAVFSATVEDNAPLKTGAGKYLSAKANTAGGVSYAGGSINRNYTDGIDPTQPVKYTFLIRPEVISSQTRYMIFDAPVSQPSTGPNMTWAIVLAGASWNVFNGDQAGGGKEIQTGVTAEKGAVYAITVNADPTAKTFTLKIADAAGGVLYTSEALGLRSNTSDKLGGYLTFAFADTIPDTPDAFGFSIDSVSISQGR
ncbi:MAG: hypothetical protein ACFUZC_02795 [Chthoniobacteraceae bacterium]